MRPLPHPALQVIYPKEVMVSIIRWALENDIHVISDEIYANSVFGDLTTPGKPLTKCEGSKP